jgi:hypothetical protein
LTYLQNLDLEAYFLTIGVLESPARRPNGPQVQGQIMKTKNQAEPRLLELATDTAANEDGISPNVSRDSSPTARMQAWSPLEVWRTRVKTPAQNNRADASQIQG